MALERALVVADITHRRVTSKRHKFAHRVYYVCLPLHALNSAANCIFSINKFNLFSFYENDHGFNNQSCENWARSVLAEQEIGEICDGNIELLTMPRLIGFCFNPVSFWFCKDKTGRLRAVIAEVNNTFGERHSYLLAHENTSVITDQHWLKTRKIFCVSPFLEVCGSYRFRFRIDKDRIAVWINYHDNQDVLVLKTSLMGRRWELSAGSMCGCFFRYPLVTLKVIIMIYFHALCMITKGFRYYRKSIFTKPTIGQ